MMKEPKVISIRVRIATITVATLTTVLAAGSPVQAAASPVQAARLTNCNEVGAVTPCFEQVWANGAQLKMTFIDLNPKPSNARTHNFYVTAPQTDIPQGRVPFLHDHVVGEVASYDPGDNRGNDRVRYHGFFVLCSAQGISSGVCVPTMTPIPGLGTVPLAKTVNGRMLRSVHPIESPANSAFITLFDTGGVFIATIKHGQEDESR
jgi:hypothetical protein